ncbi:hypothetical protein [Runella aurantiaca]|uniref:CHAT domain-containing protein n=1 Tax=Runella aurantiaca TaxID=2282308 RepID=A0A369IC84_9BACT|nr:hypothetical protein [Runella aurantiaca]RDB06652.1 hypothetical protein DVG78_07895 [Runella aurantiaca]
MNTLLLCFSNSQEAPLPNLTEEDRSLFDTLSPRQVLGHFQIVRESYATISSVIQRLETYQDNLTVFHYAGHAGKEGLLLDDAWAQVGGLAAMLARCPNLKLIFLNGCATLSLVEELRKHKIQAGIIGTQAPVGDDHASTFSRYLYKHLSNQYSLGEAIQRAKDALNFSIETTLQTRGLGENIEVLDSENWVFINPSGEADQWSLSTTSINQTYVPNAYLINQAFEAIIEYDSSIKEKFDNEKIDDEDLLFKRDLLIDFLPYPLAEPLRCILCPDTDNQQGLIASKPSINRIRAYQDLFDSTISLLISTLLSQIRNLLLSPHQPLTISAESLATITQYLKGDAVSFADVLRCLREILEKHQVPYFVEELKLLVNLYYNPNNTTLAKSIDFLMDLKIRFPYDKDIVISESLCRDICEMGETHLSNIAGFSGFWVRYNLQSYKNIQVIKFFGSLPKYRHKSVTLKSSLIAANNDRNRRYRDEPVSTVLWESQSVLLTKKSLKNDQAAFLNVAPFILDLNVFVKSDNNFFDLYIFEKFSSLNQSIYFRCIGNPQKVLKIDRNSDDFEVLREQFNAFTKNLLNINYWEL